MQNKQKYFDLVNQLEENTSLTRAEWIELISNISPELSEYVFAKSRKAAEKYYGKTVYARGLIEFTNYCKQNCYYCGIRAGNKFVNRYRLSKAEILECCKNGYQLGFRTFVLQGGEDNHYTDDLMVSIISEIRQNYPDCAITLSIGEKEYHSYKAFFDAGANRYLLRHETYDCEHYSRLHPTTLSAKNRQKCLENLREIGYQVGTGFMVGSPYQTVENLADDMLFIKKLNPHMVGIGPFIPHIDSKFKDFPAGSLELTLFMLGLIRLMLPAVLLPSTTALGTIHPNGRERGILAGGNVVMPNLSPLSVRENYLLYDNKISTGDEAAESLSNLSKKFHAMGYEIITARGDSKNK